MSGRTMCACYVLHTICSGKVERKQLEMDYGQSNEENKRLFMKNYIMGTKKV